MTDSPRIQELRRRVQLDPASPAFAQLAEELRRSGRPQEAVEACRAGLEFQPAYISARATLGRALLDLEMLDAALAEFHAVLEAAPDHLSALKGVGEAHQRGGRLEAALDAYRQALTLAREDRELLRAVASLEAVVRPPAPATPPPVPVPVPAGSQALARLERLLAGILADRARRG